MRVQTREVLQAAVAFSAERLREDSELGLKDGEAVRLETAAAHAAEGRPLPAPERDRLVHALERYLGHLSRGGYSGQEPPSREHVQAVHTAQDELRAWPVLAPVTEFEASTTTSAMSATPGRLQVDVEL